MSGEEEGTRHTPANPLGATDRERRIVRTSVLGIVANVLLAIFKAAVGLLSSSIAITLDAVNNLSDALSSVITILGTRLAAKPADKEHPLGYGRVEYLSATVIAVIVLYAGVTSAAESVKKIVSPEAPDYSVAALAVVAAGIVVKLALGRHVKRVGEDTSSDSLVASGTDALSDAILSASTLGAALLYLACGVSLEAWVGALISGFIVKAGCEMLRDTLGQILGERVTTEVTDEVKDIAGAQPGVLGVYDLILHSYGPERLVGSLHVEVPDDMDATRIDELTRCVQQAVYLRTDGKVIIEAVGVYARSGDAGVEEVRRGVEKIVRAHEHVLQLHGFHLDGEKHLMTFDVVVSFDAPDRQGEFDQILSEVRVAYPQYRVYATLDTDVSVSE